MGYDQPPSGLWSYLGISTIFFSLLLFYPLPMGKREDGRRGPKNRILGWIGLYTCVLSCLVTTINGVFRAGGLFMIPMTTTYTRDFSSSSVLAVSSFFRTIDLPVSLDLGNIFCFSLSPLCVPAGISFQIAHLFKVAWKSPSMLFYSCCFVRLVPTALCPISGASSE